MAARVASADETAESERATIEAGTSAAELMRRAGEGAAGLIARTLLVSGDEVFVFAGGGNNGGDGWVVAECLARGGFATKVIEVVEPRSEIARQARHAALDAGLVRSDDAEDSCGVVVDALLGTGSSGNPRGAIANAVTRISELRQAGAKVASLDLPSGLDATTGEHEGSVAADLTVSFGTVKRGHLLARDVCGRITVMDIGLDEGRTMSCLPLLLDTRWVRARVPGIPASAHKGTRKTIAVIGGGKGMAGAAILAGEGALRAGVGLLRIVTAPGNEVAVHAGIPAAIVQPWPDSAAEIQSLCDSVDAIAIGPGLGQTAGTRHLVERVLLAWNGPVVVDADALNVFAGDLLSLAQLMRGRPAVITPHPAELARLVGISTADVSSRRFDIGLEVASQLGAAVLLKGMPTVIFSPSGERFVSATGTAALATGGSGDVLTGMAATLFAQMCATDSACTAAEASACAAFVHGRAAELCGSVRGVTLDDVLHAMQAAWNDTRVSLPAGVLAELESFS